MLLVPRLTTIFAAALITIAHPALAQTPNPEAVRRELIEAMRAHTEHDRFELAFNAASAALAIRSDRELLCNAGILASHLERFPEAAEFLTDCIRLTTEPTTDPDEHQKRLTHASKLAIARTRVATLRVLSSGLATITVNHRNFGLLPADRDVFVPANTPIQIHAKDFYGEGSKQITIAPGHSETVVVPTLRREKSPAFIAPAAPALRIPAPSPASTSSPLPDATAFRVSLITTLLAAGATAHLSFSAWMDIRSAYELQESVKRRYDCGCECNVQPECSEAFDKINRGESFRDLAIFSGVTTGIGLAITLIGVFPRCFRFEML